MINACGKSAMLQYLAVFGPLGGVVIGAGLTWWIQRSEWGRQRRWELRRDATLDAVRGLADLEDSVTNLDSALTPHKVVLTDDARAALQNMQLDAMMQFRRCCSAYKRAHIIADLAVGGNLSGALSKYFQFALPLARQGLKNRAPFFEDASKKKQLALMGNAVVMSARESLGIKDAGDLPLLDDPN